MDPSDYPFVLGSFSGVIKDPPYSIPTRQWRPFPYSPPEPLIHFVYTLLSLPTLLSLLALCSPLLARSAHHGSPPLAVAALLPQNLPRLIETLIHWDNTETRQAVWEACYPPAPVPVPVPVPVRVPVVVAQPPKPKPKPKPVAVEEKKEEVKVASPPKPKPVAKKKPHLNPAVDESVRDLIRRTKTMEEETSQNDKRVRLEAARRTTRPGTSRAGGSETKSPRAQSPRVARSPKRAVAVVAAPASPASPRSPKHVPSESEVMELTVEIRGAEGLPKMDTMGKIDAYCEVSLVGPSFGAWSEEVVEKKMGYISRGRPFYGSAAGGTATEAERKKSATDVCKSEYHPTWNAKFVRVRLMIVPSVAAVSLNACHSYSHLIGRACLCGTWDA